jgi:serine/threonine-protein kinase RsbW
MYEQAILATRQRSWEQSYPGTADQLRHVRGALRDLLGSCPVGDDAVYLFSELCGNAIVHTDSGKVGGTFTIRVQHFVNEHVQGEVEDQGSDWDGDLSASAASPHGLFLLLSMASSCGVRRTGRTHVVWFRLSYPDQHLIPLATGPEVSP